MIKFFIRIWLCWHGCCWQHSVYLCEPCILNRILNQANEWSDKLDKKAILTQERSKKFRDKYMKEDK